MSGSATPVVVSSTRSHARAYAPRVDVHVAGGADGDAAGQRGVLDVHHGEVPAQALGEEEGGHAAPWVLVG